MTFSLHPQLESDTLFIADLSLSTLLLMNDKRFPWFILVPRKADIKEIYQLESHDQQQLLKEINSVAKWAQVTFKAEKMNVAALGNMVPQLHIHVIARHKMDEAWPKPVWGMGTKIEYLEAEAKNIIEKMQVELGMRDESISYI